MDEVKMTLEQFVATRKFIPDAVGHPNSALESYAEIFDSEDTDNKRAIPVFLYADALVIEIVTDEWPEDAKAEGSFYLMVFNEQYLSFDLAKLETELYDIYLNWS